MITHLSIHLLLYTFFWGDHPVEKYSQANPSNLESQINKDARGFLCERESTVFLRSTLVTYDKVADIALKFMRLCKLFKRKYNSNFCFKAEIACLCYGQYA
jgi:hypothetical protein